MLYQLESSTDRSWAPWHPHELSRRLKNVSRPWCVVGGWALDLWHGRQTREHEDLEFTILRDDFEFFLDAFEDMEFFEVRDGVISFLRDGKSLSKDTFQIWCLDRRSRRWRVDMMIEPGVQDVWVYKRHPAVTRPRSEMLFMTAAGIPYLNPAAVLLFKAKHRRTKDQKDFEETLKTLSWSERRWLKTCLDLLHPGHEWLQAL